MPRGGFSSFGAYYIFVHLDEISKLLFFYIQLSIITQISIADSNIFLEYIFPSVKGISSDPEPVVRGAFAKCLIELGIFYLQLIEISRNFS